MILNSILDRCQSLVPIAKVAAIAVCCGTLSRSMGAGQLGEGMVRYSPLAAIVSVIFSAVAALLIFGSLLQWASKPKPLTVILAIMAIFYARIPEPAYWINQARVFGREIYILIFALAR